jgi:hypothetical protein
MNKSAHPSREFSPPLTGWRAGCLLGVAFASSCFAGQTISKPFSKSILEPEASPTPGRITIGWKSSEDLQGGYADVLHEVSNVGGLRFFFNGRASFEDNSQEVYTFGGGARYLLPDHEVILGANVFYDSIDSERGHHFNQLGFGAEVLSHWVDARFNYYLPDSDQAPLDRTSRTTTERSQSDNFVNGSLFSRTTTEVTTRRTFSRFEAALEGWNAEIGAMVPGLDRYCEVRLFAGYYHYENPFGADFEGWKGRVEVRPVPGLIAGVEYWEDEYLNGGNWTAELSVSLPFDLGRIAQGKNPFAGAAESFRPKSRDFRERLTDLVVRSHRIKTITSDPVLVDQQRRKETEILFFGTPNPPAPPPPPPPPPAD